MADSFRRRSRSRSPPRRPKGSRGFKWKESRPNDDRNDRQDSRRDHGRRRDYRDRSPQRDRPRDRNNEDRAWSPRRLDSGSKPKSNDAKKETKDKKAPKPAAPIGPGEEMIIVNINNRLGTKTAIPCLPSDTVGQLKLMIAARIGREPGQIMLRRQGERPFKDPITLEDYGISNGVQLDLEVDTGD